MLFLTGLNLIGLMGGLKQRGKRSLWESCVWVRDKMSETIGIMTSGREARANLEIISANLSSRILDPGVGI